VIEAYQFMGVKVEIRYFCVMNNSTKPPVVLPQALNCCTME